MRALVLGRRRDIDLPLAVGPDGVRVRAVGICGSGVDCCTHGRIGTSAVPAEASGSPRVRWTCRHRGSPLTRHIAGQRRPLVRLEQARRPGGCLVGMGGPVEPVRIDVSSVPAEEIRIETVCRHADVFDRALATMPSGKVDLKTLVTETFPFEDSMAAFERAAEGRPDDVKRQIRV